MYKDGDNDNAFQRKFEDFAPKPSNRIWENLQSSLPVPVPFYKKPSFWKASLVALFMVGGLSYFFSQYDLQIALVKQNQQVAQAPSNLVKNNQIITRQNTADPSEILKEGTAADKSLRNTVTISETNGDNNQNTKLAAASKLSPNKADKKANADRFRANRLRDKLLMAGSETRSIANSIPSNNSSNTAPQDFSIVAPLAVKGTNLQNLKSQTGITETAALGALPVLTLSELSRTLISEDIPVFKKTDQQFGGPFADLKGLSFGVTYAVNNTWLLNNKENLRTSTGTLEYRLDFGPAYGFTLGYTFNPNWGVQLDWVVNSNQGQKWSNQYGNYISYKENNLTYSHFPLLLKHKRAKESKLTKKPFVLNYIVGVQYSRLKSAEINVDNGQAKDLLKKTDWGLVVGFDYDLYFNKDFFFTVGTRSSIAASNNPLAIFSNKRNESRNFLMGVQASLHYKFSK